MGEGLGKWVIADTINAKNYVLAKKSAQPCPHADDDVRWQFRDSKQQLKLTDKSLDVGCSKSIPD